MGLTSPKSDYEYTWCANCAVEFASPILKQRRDDGRTFFCPNGHPLSFGNGEADRLRARIAEQDRLIKLERDRVDWERSQRKTAERRHSAAKGRITKIKNRVGRGVCPCCNRTFQNLLRHMGTQHPDFTKQN